MIILLIEDDQEKKTKIESYLTSMYDNENIVIESVSSYKEACSSLYSKDYDLIIFDLFLPPFPESNNTKNVSDDLLYDYSQSRNYNNEAIVLTAFEIRDIENIKKFNELGITVVNYESEAEKWKVSLDLKIEKVKQTIRYDFLIFCGLRKEREAFREANCEICESINIGGIDGKETKIGKLRGLCIVPKRMGLVNMAVTVTKAIEKYQPKLVAMSGVCAGIKKETNLLDLIIADPCWEYQGGKIKDEGTAQEFYQVTLDNDLRIDLNLFSEQESTLKLIKKDIHNSLLADSRILLGPIVSGSKVVASNDAVSEILLQNRKILGIEMEIDSLYEAAIQSLSQPLFFAVKAVVDFADHEKGDDCHIEGSILSARFVVEFMRNHEEKVLGKFSYD